MGEAMALGLPVIALNWGGPAMLADASNALYVQPGSEEAVVAGIATAMKRLARDGALAESLSVAARAERLFAWRALRQAGSKITS